MTERVLPIVTIQQRRCLELLSRGRSLQEISTELAISVSGVEMHLSAAYKRLEVPNGPAAVRVCCERGVFQAGA